MRIKNVKIYTSNHIFEEGSILIEDGIILQIQPGNASIDEENEAVDGRGAYLLPGLIDMHLHGCLGNDVCDNDPEGLKTIAAYELSRGVTAFAPATLTLSEDNLIKTLEKLAAFAKGQTVNIDTESYEGKQNEPEALLSDLVGINMEGPFISSAKSGAQDASYIRTPNVTMAEAFIKAADGYLKVLGCAPEQQDNREGEVSFVKAMKEAHPELHIAVTHTGATYEEAEKAFAEGANHVTHICNGMLPFHHREPAVIGAAFDNSNVTAELICDGIHVHPSMVRALFKMMGRERLILVSDSMRGTGLEDGGYKLGELDVVVSGKRAVLNSDRETLAGSVSDLLTCLQTAVLEVGIPLEEVIPCVTENPAKKLNLWKQRGSIEVGKKADLVFLASDLSLKKVIKDGKFVIDT